MLCYVVLNYILVGCPWTLLSVSVLSVFRRYVLAFIVTDFLL